MTCQQLAWNLAWCEARRSRRPTREVIAEIEAITDAPICFFDDPIEAIAEWIGSEDFDRLRDLIEDARWARNLAEDEQAR